MENIPLLLLQDMHRGRCRTCTGAEPSKTLQLLTPCTCKGRELGTSAWAQWCCDKHTLSLVKGRIQGLLEFLLSQAEAGKQQSPLCWSPAPLASRVHFLSTQLSPVLLTLTGSGTSTKSETAKDLSWTYLDPVLRQLKRIHQARGEELELCSLSWHFPLTALQAIFYSRLLQTVLFSHQKPQTPKYLCSMVSKCKCSLLMFNGKSGGGGKEGKKITCLH